jgi:hypothetical protein
MCLEPGYRPLCMSTAGSGGREDRPGAGPGLHAHMPSCEWHQAHPGALCTRATEHGAHGSNTM